VDDERVIESYGNTSVIKVVHFSVAQELLYIYIYINLTVIVHCVGLIQCQIVHVGYEGCVETRSAIMTEAGQIHNSYYI